MKTMLLALTAVLALTACGPNPKDQWTAPQTGLETIKGLEDCSLHILKRGGITSPLYIVRCPNSTVSVTHREGKTDAYTVTDSSNNVEAPQVKVVPPPEKEQPLCLVGTLILPCTEGLSLTH